MTQADRIDQLEGQLADLVERLEAIEARDHAPEPLLNAKELSLALGLAESRGEESVYRRTAAGEFPCYRLPTGMRFRLSEVLAAFHDPVEAGTVTPIRSRNRRSA